MSSLGKEYALLDMQRVILNASFLRTSYSDFSFSRLKIKSADVLLNSEVLKHLDAIIMNHFANFDA